MKIHLSGFHVVEWHFYYSIRAGVNVVFVKNAFYLSVERRNDSVWRFICGIVHSWSGFQQKPLVGDAFFAFGLAQTKLYVRFH
jgi:hypothetical protein